MLQLEASGRRGLIECANACGYFGYPATNNLCNLCYRDFLQSVHSAPAAADKVVPAAEKPAAAQISAATSGTAPAVKAAPNRCASCRKKVPLPLWRHVLRAAPVRGEARVRLRLQDGGPGEDRREQPARRGSQDQQYLMQSTKQQEPHSRLPLAVAIRSIAFCTQFWLDDHHVFVCILEYCSSENQIIVMSPM
jgi:hypothetical protein